MSARLGAGTESSSEPWRWVARVRQRLWGAESGAVAPRAPSARPALTPTPILVSSGTWSRRRHLTEPNVGPELTTPRSRPETGSRVGRLSD